MNKKTIQRKNLFDDLYRLFKKKSDQEFRVKSWRHTKMREFIVKILIGKADYFNKKWITDKEFEILVNEDTGDIII